MAMNRRKLDGRNGLKSELTVTQRGISTAVGWHAPWYLFQTCNTIPNVMPYPLGAVTGGQISPHDEPIPSLIAQSVQTAANMPSWNGARRTPIGQWRIGSVWVRIACGNSMRQHSSVYGLFGENDQESPRFQKTVSPCSSKSYLVPFPMNVTSYKL